MIRFRTLRLIIFALAFPMPVTSVFASLMAVSCLEPIEINWNLTESTHTNVPVPEVPNEPKQSAWNLIYGLAGSMEPSVRSLNIHVTNCHSMTIPCFVPEKQSEQLCLIDFQFILDVVRDVREKPPRSSFV